MRIWLFFADNDIKEESPGGDGDVLSFCTFHNSRGLVYIFWAPVGIRESDSPHYCVLMWLQTPSTGHQKRHFNGLGQRHAARLINSDYLFSFMFSSNSKQSLLMKVTEAPVSDVKVFLVYF